jgi:hypothetical protein
MPQGVGHKAMPASPVNWLGILLLQFKLAGWTLEAMPAIADGNSRRTFHHNHGPRQIDAEAWSVRSS